MRIIQIIVLIKHKSSHEIYNSVNTKPLTAIKCHFIIHIYYTTVILVLFSYIHLHPLCSKLNCIKSKIFNFDVIRPSFVLS